jgi:hypothetical protein
MFSDILSLSNQELHKMLFKLVLILATLDQLVSSQHHCNPYGPKIAGLEAKYSQAYGGNITIINCVVFVTRL